MTQVYVEGRPVRLKPQQAIGKGGEADVYRYGRRQVLKLWKGPDHPDLSGVSAERRAARKRLEMHQDKMRAFPAGLPPRVVRPEQWVTDRPGRKILGYTMVYVRDAELLVRYSEAAWRGRGVDNGMVCRIFLDLAATLGALHRRGVVVGDFNDLNVLVKGAEAHLIDADSFQYGRFPCTVFTPRFFDPLLLDPDRAAPLPGRPYGADSDWYAFAAMLMQCLLFAGPYGGVYRPRDPAARIVPEARPRDRITIFHPEVRYPRPAAPPRILPDELLECFRQIFVSDRRGPFPERLLERARWKRCSRCGREHGHRACPLCSAPVSVPAAVASEMGGTIRARHVFTTEGVLLAAAVDGGTLLWLYHEGGRFIRESGEVVLRGEPDPGMTFRLTRTQTLLAYRKRALSLGSEGAGRPMAVDWCGTDPAIAVGAGGCFRVEGGRLTRDGPLGPEHVGDVLAGQTRFWVGRTFGFGFYRAGELCGAFVFDAVKRGINDDVPLSPLRGNLLGAGCTFTDDSCWFFTTTREGGRTVQRCSVIGRDGTVIAEAHSVESGDTWLSRIGGRCPAGGGILAATDEGIIGLRVESARIATCRTFPDTEPYVNGQSELLPLGDGVAVVNPRTILVLSMEGG